MLRCSATRLAKKRLWSFIPQASHHADEAKRVISTPCFVPSLLTHKRFCFPRLLQALPSPSSPLALPAPSSPATPSLLPPWAPAHRPTDHRSLQQNRWHDTEDFWPQRHTRGLGTTPEWLPIKGASSVRIYLLLLATSPRDPWW